MDIRDVPQRKAFRFYDTVPKSDSKIFSYQTLEDCTMERIVMRFYPGLKLDLTIYPYIEHNNGQITKIIAGEDVVRGEDIVIDFDIALPLQAGDTIYFVCTNDDATYNYPVDISFEIDALGGYERVL